MRTAHDILVWQLTHSLLHEGHRAASEVGIPGGRVDVVRLGSAKEWLELYEVKLRAPEAGIPQLERYGEFAPDAALTLVVPSELVTEKLQRLARGRVGLRSFDPVPEFKPAPGPYPYLPYIHPTSTAAMSARWAKERLAA